jgi:transposase
MSNVLSEEKRQEILALGRLGWALRRIEQATGVRRETASAYLKAAGIAVRAPRGRRAPKPANGGEALTDYFPQKPGAEVATDPGGDTAKPASPHEALTDSAVSSAGSRSPAAASQCEGYRDVIDLGLSRGRNAMAIWQELVDDHGYAGAYTSVQRYVRKARGVQTPEARAVIVTAPGEEAQVDYGTGPMVRDATGKYRRTRLFVLTLGCSRKAVRLLVFRSSSRVWAELHEKAFRRLGGAVRVVVLDNLKEGVLLPDAYDPSVNPLYRDVLAHYGAVALPCRVRDPDRKGKVESGVGHAKNTPLRGLRFESLEEAQQYLDRWEARWADTRIHGTTKRQVAQMFAEERSFLLPLPAEPFRYYQYGERSVHLDGCVEVEAAYYSAPPGWVGRLVAVQWDGRHVRILDPKTGLLLREHLRQQRGRHRIQADDRPAHTPPETGQLLWRAGRAGTYIGPLCVQIHQREKQEGVRRIQGVLALARKFGIGPVDDACAAALEVGVPTYRFVRRYLERHPATTLTMRQVDPLIRHLTQYRDLIDRLTEKEHRDESR